MKSKAGQRLYCRWQPSSKPEITLLNQLTVVRKGGEALADLMNKSADEQTPWAAFSDQSVLWSAERMKVLANAWPNLTAKKLSLGDATIKNVAEYYAEMGYKVEILTGDQGLKGYQPIAPPEIPRRKQR
jgi:hypothetical protein